MNNYEQAVAQEEENRRLGFLQIAKPLCGVPQVALTWRHVIELSLANNAYFSSREPTSADLEQYLWRLHPCFQRPNGERANVRAHDLELGASRPSWLRCRLAYWKVVRVCAKLNPNETERTICERILESFQDAPVSSTGENPQVASLAARMQWFDHFQHYYSSHGHQPDAIWDMGVALCFQTLRAHYIATGEADTRCIPPSASLKRFED